MSDRQADQLPGPDLEDAIVLAHEIRELLAATTGLFDRIEEVTALRAGEIWALIDIARAPGHLEDLARRLGQPPHVTANLVAALTRRGLIHSTPEQPLLALTDAGSVALSQINGMQIRLLDRITTALGPDGTQALHHALHDLPAALEAATARAGPSRHRADGSIRST